jgi:acyl-CoA dehydrogenase
MRGWIAEDVEAFGRQVRRFISTTLVPAAGKWEADRCVDRESWKRAGAAGLLCASIPDQYGGGGGTLAHEAIVIEEIARAGLGGGFGAGHGVHSAIVARYILTYGTEAQKSRWLPAMAAGQSLGAIAMTEPGAGSDLRSMSTRAVPAPGGWRLRGQKTFITNGQTADLIVVAARTEAGQDAGAISLLVVEAADAKEFRRGRNLHKIGMHAQDTSELFFDDVFVPEANVLGRVGQGLHQLLDQLAWERMTCAIQAGATMELAVARTRDHVRLRQAFGAPLLDLQNTQFTLADCHAQAAVGRAFIDQSMAELLEGRLTADTAAVAKLWTTDALGRVTDACLQLHGGAGYMADNLVGRLWTEARAMRIYAGSNEIMKLIIARALSAAD